MKNLIILGLSLLCIFNISAQKIVNQPKTGSATTSNITFERITLADTATIIDCKIVYKPGWWVNIPKKTCIKVDNKDEAYFIKNIPNYQLDGKIWMPESGEITLQMIFPPIDPNAAILDYMETEGQWAIYDIELVPQKYTGILQESLVGNWFNTDGSKNWVAGLFEQNIIFENQIWNYTKLNEKGKTTTLELKNDKDVKKLMIKVKDENTCFIGTDKKNMILCSRTPISKEGYQLSSNPPLESPDFIITTTQYSGYLKGFSPKMSQRTGMLYVNNIFTGDQISHLIKINDDGTFTTDIPLSHSQSIYIRLPNYNGQVYLEPGKELIQYIDLTRSSQKERTTLFMGSSAKVNRDLALFHTIQNFDYKDSRKLIGQMSPREYMNYCNEKALADRKEWKQVQDSLIICRKAIELSEMDLNFRNAINIISYNMSRMQLSRNDPSIRKMNMSEKELDIMRTLPLDNPQSVMCSRYTIFVNRLMYDELLMNRSLFHVDMLTFKKEIGRQNIKLNDEERALLNAAIENSESEYAKQSKLLNDKFMDIRGALFNKHMKVVRSFMQENRNKIYTMKAIADRIIESGGTLTTEEQEMIDAFAAIQTEENIQKAEEFNTKYLPRLSEFNKKHKKVFDNIRNTRRRNYREAKMKEYWGMEHNFFMDVANAQSTCPSMEKYNTLTDDELSSLTEIIKTPAIIDYITEQNKVVLAKIEENKKNSKAVVNKVPETEGEKLFDEIVKKYRGSVVFVDFWATWCGPCRGAISRIKPLKEELKDEKVVFVYITNPSSPQETWKNMIADIKGEHYRVSQDEWNILASQFKISGIPHITLVGKNGQVINPHLSHGMNNQAVKSLLLKHINNN